MYEAGALWYVPEESKDQIAKLAPSVAINVARVSLPTPIQRYAELGAVPRGGPDRQEGRPTPRPASRPPPRRCAPRPRPTGGLKVLAASGSPDVFYASNPAIGTDLMYFTELGVNLVVPDKLDAGGYFESLSWENADKYRADLILLDNRTIALQPEDLAAKPGWAALLAVKADQVTSWDTVPRFSYAGAAPLVERLANAIQSAKKVA